MPAPPFMFYRFTIGVVLTLLVGFVSGADAAPSRPLNDSAQGPIAKTQAIESLKKARDLEQEEIIKIEKEMKLKVSETQVYQVGALNSTAERAQESRWFNYGENLRQLSAKRQEALSKQKMLDQLMFEIDSKWNGQALRSFLEHSFLDMSLGELTDLSPEINRALFYSYMSVAIREVPERTEDLISFLIGYMNFSSVSKPRPPNTFMNSRNYSNGSKSMTAQPSKSESISQMVEKRLKVVEEMRSANANAPDKISSKKLDSKSEQNTDSGSDEEEDFDHSKIIKPKESDKLKPSAAIINFAPERVSELLIKD